MDPQPPASPIIVSALPLPPAGAAQTRPVAAVADILPARIQIALFAILFGLVLAVAWHTLRDPAPNAESPATTSRPGRVEINRADVAELMLLPGIGPGLAERIVARRAARGPFEGLADLGDVPGIGPMTLEKLRPHIILSWAERPQALSRDRTSAPALAPASFRNAKATALVALVDLNRAALEELQTLPGIGPKLAQRILDARGVRPFESLADVRRVPGIGPKTLEKLRPHVTFGAPPSLTRLQ